MPELIYENKIEKHHFFHLELISCMIGVLATFCYLIFVLFLSLLHNSLEYLHDCFTYCFVLELEESW